jgi:hypothetical protein
VSADTVGSTAGLRAEIDWTKAKTFVIQTQNSYSDLAPLTVNIKKPPANKSASFFLVVEGATGTSAIVVHLYLTWK